LKDYKAQSTLKKEAMNVLVKMLNNKEIYDLKKQFELLDIDNSGMIHAQELKTALQQCGF